MKLWVLRLVPAIILAQTLYFKFTGAPESVEIFTKVGFEPWSRLFTGILELFAVVLILIPLTSEVGALLVCGLMAGAILSHLFILGIEVAGDGGLLFGLACVALISASTYLGLRRKDLRAKLESYRL